MNVVEYQSSMGPMINQNTKNLLFMFISEHIGGTRVEREDVGKDMEFMDGQGCSVNDHKTRCFHLNKLPDLLSNWEGKLCQSQEWGRRQARADIRAWREHELQMCSSRVWPWHTRGIVPSPGSNITPKHSP
jgi:hypothetical protein